MRQGACHVTAFSASVALSAADGAPALVMAEDGTATQRVRLIPMGSFATRGKGKFLVRDLAAAQGIVALSQQYASVEDIVVDYDHQTKFAAIPGVGGTAEAAGWIKPASLSAMADGIWGTVEWTKDAAAKINARKYRYLSPNIAHDPNTGQVFALLNAGLTNSPAIVGLTTLAASTAQPTKETYMDMTALAAALGLDATATLDEITAAAQARTAALSAAQGQLAALNQALGLAGDAVPTAALSAATTLKAGAGDQAALMTSMQAQLTSLTAERNERIVNDHIAAGRVTPGQKEHFIALMRTDPATATALMAGAPAAVAGEQVPGTPAPGTAITALSADQKHAASVAGVSEEAFLKTLQESAA